MKNFKTFALSLLALCFVSSAFAGDPPAVKVNVNTYTVAELKAAYGDNIRLDETIQALDDAATVTFATLANPCDAFPDFELCGPAAAEAGRMAMAAARACCCDIIYGWECCDPSTGSAVSYLAIQSPPRNCNN